MITYRTASPKDAEEIARLHYEYINQGFLRKLGLKFLILLYSSMVASKSVICIVAVDGESVIGFVTGAINLKRFYIDFIKSNVFKASFIVLPKIINYHTVFKVFETILYPKKVEGEFPEAELLSIVVKKTYQGKRIAENLFEYLKKEFKKSGIHEFKVLVGENLQKAVRFYEKMNGKLLGKTEVHKGEISRIYGWKI